MLNCHVDPLKLRLRRKGNIFKIILEVKIRLMCEILKPAKEGGVRNWMAKFPEAIKN